MAQLSRRTVLLAPLAGLVLGAGGCARRATATEAAATTPVTGATSAGSAASASQASTAATETATATETIASRAAAGTFSAAAELTEELLEIPRGSHVEFGVGVYDALTGRRYVYQRGAPYEMASTVKVDILLGLLWRAYRADRSLTSSEKSLATSMIRYSDNSAADALWTANGRQSGMRAMWKSLGITGMTPGPLGYWGTSTTTIAARLQALGIVERGTDNLPAARSKYALSLMRSVDSAQNWGVGDVARSGETVAVKNGWLPRSTESGRWVISTTGIITGDDTDLRLAVSSHGHTSESAGIDFVEECLETARSVLQV